MIRVKIVGRKDKLEKQFNGLDVFLDVLEDDGKECAQCKRSDVFVIKRSFKIVKIVRGCVPLRVDTHFSRQVLHYVRERMGHDQSLCLSCYEKMADDNLGGFEPAD